MFIGVAVGNASLVALDWILVAAAGIFLYVALVDMVSFHSQLLNISRSSCTANKVCESLKRCPALPVSLYPSVNRVNKSLNFSGLRLVC